MALPSAAHRVGWARAIVRSLVHRGHGHRVSLIVSDTALVRWCNCVDGDGRPVWWWSWRPVWWWS